jgi:hypothetical protein
VEVPEQFNFSTTLEAKEAPPRGLCPAGKKMKKSVPIFSNELSRNISLATLKRRFPDVSIKVDTALAGSTGIEIEAEEEKLDEIISFMKERFYSSLVEFVCIN